MTLGQTILRARCNYKRTNESVIVENWLKCIAVLRKHPGQFLTVDEIAAISKVNVNQVPLLLNDHRRSDFAESERGEGNRVCWRAL